MLKRSLAAVAVAAVLALGAMPAVASTGTVECPSLGTVNSDPVINRYIQVTNAEVGGSCSYYSGNLDSNPSYPFGLTLIDKDIYGLGQDGGTNEGSLVVNVTATNYGTWSVAQNVFDSYDRVFLGFHFGGGNGEPDSVIVELNRAGNPITGGWAFWMQGGTDYVNQGLSNAYLFASDPSRPPNEVPVPAAAWLIASGLLSMGAIGRRRIKGMA